MMLNLHQLCLVGITSVNYQDKKTGATECCKNISSYSFKENSIKFLQYWIWFRYAPWAYNKSYIGKDLGDIYICNKLIKK